MEEFFKHSLSVDSFRSPEHQKPPMKNYIQLPTMSVPPLISLSSGIALSTKITRNQSKTMKLKSTNKGTKKRSNLRNIRKGNFPL